MIKITEFFFTITTIVAVAFGSTGESISYDEVTTVTDALTSDYDDYGTTAFDISYQSGEGNEYQMTSASEEYVTLRYQEEDNGENSTSEYYSEEGETQTAAININEDVTEKITIESDVNNNNEELSELEIKETIEKVEEMLKENPTLPRLSRSDILEIIENITGEQKKESELNKSRAAYMKALMVVLPYSINNINSSSIQELYTKPPITHIIGDKAESSYSITTWRPSTHHAVIPAKESNYYGKEKIKNASHNQELTEKPIKLRNQIKSSTTISESDLIQRKPPPINKNIEQLLDQEYVETYQYSSTVTAKAPPTRFEVSRGSQKYNTQSSYISTGKPTNFQKTIQKAAEPSTYRYEEYVFQPESSKTNNNYVIDKSTEAYTKYNTHTIRAQSESTPVNNYITDRMTEYSTKLQEATEKYPQKSYMQETAPSQLFQKTEGYYVIPSTEQSTKQPAKRRRRPQINNRIILNPTDTPQFLQSSITNTKAADVSGAPESPSSHLPLSVTEEIHITTSSKGYDGTNIQQSTPGFYFSQTNNFHADEEFKPMTFRPIQSKTTHAPEQFDFGLPSEMKNVLTSFDVHDHVNKDMLDPNDDGVVFVTPDLATDSKSQGSEDLLVEQSQIEATTVRPGLQNNIQEILASIGLIPENEQMHEFRPMIKTTTTASPMSFASVAAESLTPEMKDLLATFGLLPSENNEEEEIVNDDDSVMRENPVAGFYPEPTIDPSSYMNFKPLPISSESGARQQDRQVSSDMKQFLASFGLVPNDEINRESEIGAESIHFSRSQKALRTQKPLSQIDESPSDQLVDSSDDLPEINTDIMTDDMMNVLKDLGLVDSTSNKTKPSRNKIKKKERHVFKPSTHYTKLNHTEEDVERLNKLLDVIKQLTSENGTLTSEDIEALNMTFSIPMISTASQQNFVHNVNVKNKIQNKASSLGKVSNAPDPLSIEEINLTEDVAKNEVKRQESNDTSLQTDSSSFDGSPSPLSTNSSSTDEPTSSPIELPSSPSSTSSSSSSVSSSASLSSSSASSSSSSASSSASASLMDLEDSFGGGGVAPADVDINKNLPTPKPNGLYFLLDWHSFLEVGEDGKNKVNLRFEPKIGDSRNFLPVSVP